MNLLLIGGLAALGLGMVAASKKQPIADFTPFTGASGTQYVIQKIFTDGNTTVLAALNVDQEPLFTFTTDNDGNRQFVASDQNAEPGELAKALSDFQPMEGV